MNHRCCIVHPYPFRECLAEWARSKSDCPTCRTRCTGMPIRQNAIDNVIDAIASYLDPEERDFREGKLASWEEGRSGFHNIFQRLQQSFSRGTQERSNLGEGVAIGYDFPIAPFLPIGSPIPPGDGWGIAGTGMLASMLGMYATAQQAMPHGNASNRNTGGRSSRRNRNNRDTQAPQGPPPAAFVFPPPPNAEPLLFRASHAVSGQHYGVCQGCHCRIAPGTVQISVTGTPGTASYFRRFHPGCMPPNLWTNARNGGAIEGLNSLSNLERSIMSRFLNNSNA